MTAPNGCKYHVNDCGLTEQEVTELQYEQQFPTLSPEWREMMRERYGVDYDKWYPSQSVRTDPK